MGNKIVRRVGMLMNNPKGFMKRMMEITSSFFPDKLYLKWYFRLANGYKLNLKEPKTFNEKLNWLKLYNRNPLYTKLADKIEAKKIISGLIGEKYVVPLYGEYDRPNDIDFDVLPEQFVAKCNHCSGSMVICKDKSILDRANAIEVLKKGLQYDYYKICREWPYKNIPHKILVEKYMDDGTGNELRDYKFWCFNGDPKVMYCTIKGKDVYENFYDMDFNIMDIDHGFPRHNPEFEKPENFELMKELAKKISKGIPFVRVDFFNVDGKVYFGECTFFDWAGLYPFRNYEMDLKIGEWLKLPRE